MINNIILNRQVRCANLLECWKFKQKSVVNMTGVLMDMFGEGLVVRIPWMGRHVVTLIN